MSRSDDCRCPVCNRWGSPALGGYCKTHIPKEEAPYMGRSSYQAEYPIGRDFIPMSDKFGYFKNTFGYER
jgi:hypothetical protein